MIERNAAVKMLEEYGATPSLMRHALQSEAVMKALAENLGENREIWSLAGLLHDLDFPQTSGEPEKHGLAGSEALQDFLPDEALQAIRAHNGELNGCAPKSRLDFALRCGESVTGLIDAAARLRPAGYEGLTPKSLKKKMKDKAFARNVNRENIWQCEEAGLDLDAFLSLAACAMSKLPPE